MTRKRSQTQRKRIRVTRDEALALFDDPKELNEPFYSSIMEKFGDDESFVIEAIRLSERAYWHAAERFQMKPEIALIAFEKFHKNGLDYRDKVEYTPSNIQKIIGDGDAIERLRRYVETLGLNEKLPKHNAKTSKKTKI